MFPQSVFFTVFASGIYSPKKEKVQKALFCRVQLGNMYFFPTCCSFSESKAGPARAHRAMGTCCVIYEWSGHAFWVASCLHHSGHDCYVALVNNSATRSKSMLSPQRKQKRTRRRQQANARSAEREASEETGEETSIWVTPNCTGGPVHQGHMW